MTHEKCMYRVPDGGVQAVRGREGSCAGCKVYPVTRVGCEASLPLLSSLLARCSGKWQPSPSFPGGLVNCAVTSHRRTAAVEEGC